MINRRVNRILTAGILCLALIASAFAYMGNHGGIEADAASKTIAWSKAKQLFLEEMPDGAVMKYLKLTSDDGRKVYKGKGVKGNYVYSVEMNAYSGGIEDFERDYEGSRYTASKVGAVSKSTITKKIKDRVPGCYVIYVKLTRDDGRYVYEGEAYKNGYEYEFEFTKSGKLIEWDKDRV